MNTETQDLKIAINQLEQEAIKHDNLWLTQIEINIMTLKVTNSLFKMSLLFCFISLLSLIISFLK